MEDYRSLIQLSLLPGIGAVKAREILKHFRSPNEIFSASINEFSNIKGIGKATAYSILKNRNIKKADELLENTLKRGLNLISIRDPEYPAFLKQCPDAPILLQSKGRKNLNHNRMLSIVGTRKAGSRSLQLCKEFVEALSPYDVCIVSGLAYGIDIQAHRSALEHNLPTFACVAHGLDMIYPYVHRREAQLIQENGALISEHWYHEKVEKENFPKRNRIIAGISPATLVIESSLKGGSLITAKLAFDYNREVFAIPGRPKDDLSLGCNRLIQNNTAGLINTPDELISQLGWDIKKDKKKSIIPSMDSDESRLYQFLLDKEKHIDAISLEYAQQEFNLSRLLLEMELKGLIKSLPGGFYACS